MSPIERQVSMLLVVLAVSTFMLGGTLLAASWWNGQTVPLAMLGLVTLLAGLVLAWYIRQKLTQALRIMSNVLHQAADGDTEAALDIPAFPDALAESFTAMQRRMHDGEVSRHHLEGILASVSEAVFVVDEEARIEIANEAAGTLTDLPRETLIGMPIDSLLPPDSGTSSVRGGTSSPVDAEIRRAGGDRVSVSYRKSVLSDAQGVTRSAVYAVQDVDERNRTKQRLRDLECMDALTKITNRTEFQQRLQQSVLRADENHQYLALLYLDVDRFRDINDTFGHAAGDHSLQLFARRIDDALPDGSIVGRLSGDEFSVLLPPRTRIEQLLREVAATARELLRVVAKPFDVQGEEVFMSTSVGATIYPRDADNVVMLLRNADAAMNHAKRAGGNCFHIYESETHSPARERLKLKSKLSRAFDRQELRLRYQPKYRLTNGRVAGAEALIRWDMPDRGLILPSHFIPLAEESNLIVQIGEWVLGRVCADYREWQRVVPSPRRISVNLSLRQLQQQRFLDSVRKTFRRHGVSATCFELEITETTLMEDARATTRILEALYGMGLNLAIDDFGTGYSSLSALQQFPISTLKIDQSFIEDLAIDRDSGSIVRAIIEMAHSLGLDVVAEGVETQDQLDFLRRHNCDYAQGHLFGDPMPAPEFTRILADDAEGSGKHRVLFA